MPKLSFQYVRHGRRETLAQFLARRFRYHGPDRWEALVREGHVTVNGRRVEPEAILEDRHKIVYEPPHGPEPAVDPSFRILFEDDALLAVEKSGNIPTSPSGQYWHHCLVHVLQQALGLEVLHAVHRLDRETSGVNLFAKTPHDARILGREFQQGHVAKTYTAVVRGHLRAREVYIHAPLDTDPQGAIRIKQVVHPSGKEARTLFRLRALLPGASLLEVTPFTGRTHQIRVHAAFMGHPVWGDKLYGASEQSFIEWVQDGPRTSENSHLLHATALTFKHPGTGRWVTVQSPAGPMVARALAPRRTTGSA